jgi:HlyD family secretion protein
VGSSAGKGIGPGVANAAEPPPEEAEGAAGAGGAVAAEPQSPARLEGSSATRKKEEEGKIEGVFTVRDGVVSFAPVTIGITGEKDFELLSGLDEGAEIVVGPFKALRELEEGGKVRASKKKDGASSGPK